jgi:4-amino-4-deoxy-L-arabinose transferase-like glycosyltransferase
MGKSTFNKVMKIKINKGYIYLSILSVLLFVPYLGKIALFDWDEINFAESAREMLVSGNYSTVTVNYQRFWEKPPLFIWMQALSMNIFGVNEFASRFPNAIAGLISVLFMFHIGKVYYSERVGYLWVFAFIGSFTPHLYFKSGIIDPWFNLFIFSSVFWLAKGSLLAGMPRRKKYMVSAFWLGLALLTKGPAAVLIVLLCFLVVFALKRFKTFFNLYDILSFTFICVLVSFAWYGAETIKNGFWFISQFVVYQIELFTDSVAGHGQPWYYHPVVLLLGCFPSSVLAMNFFNKNQLSTQKQKNLQLWFGVLFFVVLILFSMVKTKIIHYSSLCYFPLTFFAALSVDRMLQKEKPFPKPLLGLFILIGLIMGAAFAVLPFFAINFDLNQWLISKLKDPFAVANLERMVHWGGYEFMFGILFLVGLIITSALLLLKKYKSSFFVITASVIMLMQGFMLFVLPKVANHSQGALIEFLEDIGEKDVYVETLGFKSYAQYFYAKAKPDYLANANYIQYRKENTERLKDVPSRDFEGRMFRDWLSWGKTDKDVYFVSKIQHAQEFLQVLPIEELYREGGYVFFKRVNEKVAQHSE